MHTEIKHPIVEDKITKLRNVNTTSDLFRKTTNDLALILTYEALRSLIPKEKEVTTPLTTTSGKYIEDEIVIVPVLRAGIGMMEGTLAIAPNAKVGFLGMERDHDTQKAKTYYENIPEANDKSLALLIDPMLATGGSIIASIDKMKKRGFNRIIVVTILSAPEGIKAVEDAHKDVEIITAKIDSHLNDNKYIVPGLGDAGDRIFGSI